MPPADEPAALPLQRLPMQTLHHAWAPKLGRTIVLNSIARVRLWAMLEAHPGVTRYCERPAMPDDVSAARPPDFWALRDGEPTWLVLGDEAASAEPEVDARCLQAITPQELDRHDTWIRNWLSLLPYLSMAAALDGAGLYDSVVGFFRQEASFEDAERHLAHLDPMLVRAAVIAGLHKGVLFSRDLLVQPWSGQTRIARCPPRRPHAPQ